MKSGSAPAWAVALVHEVCAAAGVTPPSRLRWRRLRRLASSGVATRRAGRIAVSAGVDLDDARHTLLHELAHWLAPEERRGRGRRRAVHHGAAFYAIAFDLFARHEASLEAALRREASRYPTSLNRAVRLSIPGAAGLLEERRAAVRARRARRGQSAWRVLVPEHAVELVRDGRWWICATCRRRLVGRTLLRAGRRGRRERHAVWTREPAEATA